MCVRGGGGVTGWKAQAKPHAQALWWGRGFRLFGWAGLPPASRAPETHPPQGVTQQWLGCMASRAFGGPRWVTFVASTPPPNLSLTQGSFRPPPPPVV